MKEIEYPFGQDWFHVKQVEPDIWAIREPKHSEDVLCFFVKGSKQNILIDTGMGLANLKDVLPDQEVTVLLTHAHWDHMGGANLFPKVSILNHPYETNRLSKGWLPSEMCGFENEEFAVPVPDNFSKEIFQVQGVLNFTTFHNGQEIDLGDKHLSVIHTPGHTPGSVCFFLEERGLLFSGDTLYPGPEYLHLPESNFEHYKQSLETLLERIGKRLKRIYPGHNAFSAEPELLQRHLLAINGILEPEAVVTGQDFFGVYIEETFKDLKHISKLKKFFIKRKLSFKILLNFVCLAFWISYWYFQLTAFGVNTFYKLTHPKKKKSYFRIWWEEIQRQTRKSLLNLLLPDG